MLNKLLYAFRTAMNNLSKNIPLNLVTSTTIAITLIIFVSFLLIVLNLSTFKQKWVDQIQIITYVKDNISSEEIEKTRQDFLKYEEVQSVTFISQAKAMELLKTSLKGQDGILEGIDENPLPCSLEIKLKKEFITLDSIECFVKKIDNNKVISDIEYGQKWLERFMTFFGLLRIVGFTLGGFLFLFTLFIVSNTIRLMVYSRRDEIEIMKLVGATNNFIKLPFFIEGAAQGFIGGVFAFLFVLAATSFISGKFTSSLHFFLGSGRVILLDPVLTIYILLLGTSLGIAGTFLSLNNLTELKN